MIANNLFVATILFAASAAGVHGGLASSPIGRQLAIFSFDDASSAANWGSQVLELKQMYLKQDEGARKAVAALYEQWQAAFAKYDDREGNKVDMSPSQRMEAFVSNLWSVAETNVRNPEKKSKYWLRRHRLRDLFQALSHAHRARL